VKPKINVKVVHTLGLHVADEAASRSNGQGRKIGPCIAVLRTASGLRVTNARNKKAKKCENN